MVDLVVLGAGFLGREILALAVAKGLQSCGVTLQGGAGMLACDVADATAMARLPEARAVVHCAASGRGGGVDAYRHVYFEGTRQMLRRWPRARHLFISSSSVYGQVDGSIVTEESATIPSRETSRILLAAEAQVLAVGGTVARLAGLYGPGRSVLLQRFLAGEAVIEEDGSRWLNQIHRDCAARAVVHLLFELEWSQVAHALFNVADSHPLQQRELYVGLAKRTGLPMPRSGPRQLERPRGWTNKRVSNAKLCATGWRPLYPCFFDALPGLLARVDTSSDVSQ